MALALPFTPSAPKMPPDRVVHEFYAALMNSSCGYCWEQFSKHTQETFAKWTLVELQKQHPEAIAKAKLGLPEVRLMFSKNDATLLKTFWKRFFINGGANELRRFGYFSTDTIEGKQATVRALLKYPNGKTANVPFQMLLEKGAWKLAYVESNLPF